MNLIREMIELLEQMEFAENDACYICYSLRPEHRENCPIAQALAKLRESKESLPTSIGNSVREIARKTTTVSSNLVRDRDVLNQAANRLDAWWKYLGELKEETNKLKDDIDKLIAGQQSKLIAGSGGKARDAIR